MRGLIPVLVEVRKYGAINYVGAIFPTLPKLSVSILNKLIWTPLL